MESKLVLDMTDILSAEAIKKTQDSLGKFVKKPPLTEKLLKKPPFKFLHDIINVVSISLTKLFNRSQYYQNNKIIYKNFITISLKFRNFVLNLK